MSWPESISNLGISGAVASVIMFTIFCITDCSKHEATESAKNRAIQLEIQKIEASKPKNLTERDFKIVPVNPETDK